MADPNSNLPLVFFQAMHDRTLTVRPVNASTAQSFELKADQAERVASANLRPGAYLRIFMRSNLLAGLYRSHLFPMEVAVIQRQVSPAGERPADCRFAKLNRFVMTGKVVTSLNEPLYKTGDEIKFEFGKRSLSLYTQKEVRTPQKHFDERSVHRSVRNTRPREITKIGHFLAISDMAEMAPGYVVIKPAKDSLRIF